MQESHVRRLVAELTETRAREAEGVARVHQMQRLVSELQAELQRQAAQAAAGPVLMLGKDFKVWGEE